MNKTKLIFPLILTILAGLGWGVLARPHDRHHTRNVSLSRAEISQATDGDVIVAMRAVGDLPGALTLKINQNRTDNTIAGGEWALVVSYIEHAAHGDHDHEEGEAGDGHGSEVLIRKGTLKGTISGGSLTLNSDGSVASVDSVQLNINGGTIEFDKVSSGHGIAHGTGLQDSRNSSGTLSLNF